MLLALLGKSLMLLALFFLEGGGGMYVYTEATFLYRENGSSMHSPSRKGRWPRPSLLSHSMKTSVCSSASKGVGTRGGRGDKLTGITLKSVS